METVEKPKFYRPIAGLSLGLNYYFGGTDVFGYHLVNFFIHLLASIFLFLFIYDTLKLPLLKGRYEKISFPLALLATLFWAANPVQESSVTYIVQRMASMAGMFSIMAMYFYLKGRTSNNQWARTNFFIFFVLSGIFAFGSKQNAAMLPASIFFYDLFLLQGSTNKNIRKSIRIIIIPLLLLSILAAKFMDFPSVFAEYATRPFTMTERLLTESRVIIFYIGLLLYPAPTRLTFLHDIQISKSLFDPWTTMLAIVGIILIIAFTFIFSRKRPLISFSVLFFFLNHIIESSFLPLELIFEHRNYLPSMLIFVPLSIFFLKAIDYFSYKKSLQFMMAFGIIFLLASSGYTTFTRNKVFKNEFLLWSDVIKKSPNLARPYFNLGRAFSKQWKIQKAVLLFKKALEIRPNYAGPYNSLGIVLGRQGKFREAILHFSKAISINPYSASPHHNMGMAYSKLGEMDKAIYHYSEALKINPSDSDGYYKLGLAFARIGKFEKAIQNFNIVLRIKPEYLAAQNHLGIVLAQIGRKEEAIRQWKDILRNYPDFLQARRNLERALTQEER